MRVFQKSETIRDPLSLQIVQELIVPMEHHNGLPAKGMWWVQLRVLTRRGHPKRRHEPIVAARWKACRGNRAKLGSRGLCKPTISQGCTIRAM